MAPLDATEFSADEGLRGGIQKGSRANVRNVAVTGRVELTPVTRSDDWRQRLARRQRLQRAATRSVGRASSNSMRATGGTVIEARGQFARVFIGDAARLNDALTLLTGVTPNIARQLQGYYLEGSRLFPLRRWRHEVAVFARFEDFDTQFRMPERLLADPRFRSTRV